MAESQTIDVVIVGAGMTGLTAARTLSERSLSVRVLEKESALGGRMSSRQVGPGLADDGCQFFTVRDPRFQSMAQQWMEDGLVFEWSRGWNDGSLAVTRDGHPRYAVRQGFASLAQELARGIDVQLSAGLDAISANDGGWRLRDVQGKVHRARAVLLTPPVPVALALLTAAGVALAEADRASLNRIEYNPCLTALFWIEQHRGLPAPGAVQRPEANLRWIADNRRKGISPEAVVFTAQAGPSYSRQLWDITDQQILSAMRVDIMPFLHDEARVVQSQLQRWRYSQPTVVYPEQFLVAQGLPNLVFAGDGFGEPWLEGAALSGLLAAEALSERLA